jgi:hypothetical protein
MGCASSHEELAPDADRAQWDTRAHRQAREVAVPPAEHADPIIDFGIPYCPAGPDNASDVSTRCSDGHACGEPSPNEVRLLVAKLVRRSAQKHGIDGDPEQFQASEPKVRESTLRRCATWTIEVTAAVNSASLSDATSAVLLATVGDSMRSEFTLATEQTTTDPYGVLLHTPLTATTSTTQRSWSTPRATVSAFPLSAYALLRLQVELKMDEAAAASGSPRSPRSPWR